MSPAPSAEERRFSTTAVFLSCLAVAVFLTALLFLVTAPALSQQEDMNPQVETPESFTNRKTSTYEAGLEALKERYGERCRIPGEGARGPFDHPPPGVVVIGGRPGGLVPDRFILEGSGVVTKVELEQVINRYRDTNTSGNPWDWVDVVSIVGSSSTTTPSGPAPASKTSSNMDCVGSSADAYIHINHVTKSCSVSTNPAGSAVNVYTMDGSPNGGVGYGPMPGWSGPSNSYTYYSPPGVIGITVTHTGSGTPVFLQFRVKMSDPGKACTGTVTIVKCS